MNNQITILEQAAEKIFVKQNPQDGNCPLWAIKFAKEIANWQKEQDEAQMTLLANTANEFKDDLATLAIKYKALLDSHNELLECLKLAYEQIHISEKQIPIKDSFNLSTHTGSKSWELFSNKMLRIENAINKAKNITNERNDKN